MSRDQMKGGRMKKGWALSEYPLTSMMTQYVVSCQDKMSICCICKNICAYVGQLASSHRGFLIKGRGGHRGHRHSRFFSPRCHIYSMVSEARPCNKLGWQLLQYAQILYTVRSLDASNLHITHNLHEQIHAWDVSWLGFPVSLEAGFWNVKFNDLR